MADWENIRHFMAVGRSGTLSGAARALKVDHATVSRRLATLEAELDVILVDRLPRSSRLTAIGQRIFDQAVTMESAADGIARIARAAHTPLIGKVTLSAPPVLAAHLLAQHLAEFRSRYPDIRLSLAAQAQQISLSRREADVALRLVQLSGWCAPRRPAVSRENLGSWNSVSTRAVIMRIAMCLIDGSLSPTTRALPICRSRNGCSALLAHGQSRVS
jgi:DNA-binding transcriptional LysR family regulator